MTDTLEVNCLVLGQESSHVFLIRIPENKTVYDLKEVVQDKKRRTFRDVDADDLQLFKVSIPVDNELDGILADFQPQNDPANSVQKLSAVWRLSQIFSAIPVDGYLHIIVQLPHSGESDPSIRTILSNDIFHR
jgi:Crinkler effector protein N-terminal domain